MEATCAECGDDEPLAGDELCAGCRALCGNDETRPGRGAFTIPVAFVLIADDEGDAAHRLVELLGRCEDDLGTGYADPLDSWWLPNHPDADGSDRGQRLTWVDDDAVLLGARDADLRVLRAGLHRLADELEDEIASNPDDEDAAADLEIAREMHAEIDALRAVIAADDAGA